MSYLKHIGLCWLFLLSLGNVTFAQSSDRYAQPVFNRVLTTTDIPFSSAIREGDNSPTTLYLDFYEPAGDTINARPLVITVFGGAFVAGGRDFSDMEEYCTRLAKHGYVAASIDYRLLSVFSLSASSVIREMYMAAQDVSSAIRYLKAHCEEYRIDTNNIFLLGNSAGSISILHEIFMSEDERPAVTFEEPDLGTPHHSGYSQYSGLSPKVTGAIAQWGGVLDLNYLDTEEFVPLCFIHGTADNKVPYDSGYCYSSLSLSFMPYLYGSHAIAEHLDAANYTDYELHTFEGEEHAFYLNSLFIIIEDKFDTCFQIVLDFFYNHLVTASDNPDNVLELNRNVFRLFPNPASNQITIHNDAYNGEPWRISVLNMYGQTLKSISANSKTVLIEISDLPSGTYFLQLTNNGCFLHHKVIKR